MLKRIIASFFLGAGALSAGDERPNVVIIVADDLGYGDVGCFGAQKCRTPQLDRMAAEGMRLTSFYVAQAVCSASRAALMTGCYSNRVGMAGALNHTSPEGLHADEWLLPEMLKERGYATGAFGKWHLGTRPQFHPMKNGFDEFMGLPYSNDNSKYHPSLADVMPPLPFYDGETISETDPDQSQFTRRITERSVAFIEKHKSEPFFLYVPHVMPHVPIFASEKYAGSTGRGLYADVVSELDDSVGQILAALKRSGVDDRTLVIFFSDNGPFLSYGTHAGSGGKLREGKLTTFEGGVRVPCIARWPGFIPAGQKCDEPVMATDLLPTLTALVSGKTSERKIDGLNILPLLRGEAGARSPHEALFFYAGEELQAVRMGRWKFHFPHPYLTVLSETRSDGKPAGYGTLKPKSITQSGIEGIASRHGYGVGSLEESLFDLDTDPGETQNLAPKQPEVIRKMKELAAGIRRELGDTLTATSGTEVRPAGRAP
jgi:arylsulfatase